MIIGFIIYAAVALIMIVIGIVQIRSPRPAHFYSGETAPRPEELTDVRGWNRCHGIMWILFGVMILLSYGIAALIGDSPLSILPMLGGMIIPIPLMVLYHQKLEKRYKK